MFGVFNCNSSRSEVPRLLVPEELFTNIAKTVGFQVNRSLSFLQDVASGGNLKQFLLVRNIYIYIKKFLLLRVTVLVPLSQARMNSSRWDSLGSI